MMKLKVDASRAETRFVYYWLRTPAVRARIEEAGRGTSSTMKKITQKHVMALPFPAETSLADQRAAVDDLDHALARIEQVRANQSETRADLDALLPSLLDRAFEGELALKAEAEA